MFDEQIHDACRKASQTQAQKYKHEKSEGFDSAFSNELCAAFTTAAEVTASALRRRCPLQADSGCRRARLGIHRGRLLSENGSILPHF